MANTQQVATEALGASVQTKLAYTASVTTGTVSVLSFNEVVGAIGVIASIIFAGFTAWSNHTKNKAIIQAARRGNYKPD